MERFSEERSDSNVSCTVDMVILFKRPTFLSTHEILQMSIPEDVDVKHSRFGNGVARGFESLEIEWRLRVAPVNERVLGLTILNRVKSQRAKVDPEPAVKYRVPRSQLALHMARRNKEFVLLLIDMKSEVPKLSEVSKDPRMTPPKRLKETSMRTRSFGLGLGAAALIGASLGHCLFLFLVDIDSTF